MRLLRSMKYRKRLLAGIVLIGVVPIWLISAGILGIVHHYIRTSEILRCEQDARKASVELEEVLSRYVNLCDLLAESPVIIEQMEKTGDLQEVYAQMYLLMRGNHENAVLHILSCDGRVRISTGNHIPRDYGLPAHNGWGIFRQATEENGGILSARDRTKVGAYGPLFSICRAIRKDGAVVGYVVMDIQRAALQSILFREAGAPAVMLADRYNYVVYNGRNPQAEGFAAALPPREKLRGAFGSFPIGGAEGNQVCFVRSSRYGLLVLEQTNIDWSIFRYVFQAVLLVDTVVIAAILLFSSWLSRSLWSPLADLADGIERVRHNDFAAALPVRRRDEIGRLAYGFNKMVRHIRRLLREVKSKEQALRIAQMRSFQEQVKPHFIYNTLDMIKWSAKLGDTGSVAELAVALGKLMRKVLGTQEFIPVCEECEILEAYIAIQKKRFSDRLCVSIDIAEEMQSLLLPKLILQPLVENAIVHGIEDQQTMGKVEIVGEIKGEYMVFSVRDNGRGMEAARAEECLSNAAGPAHIGMHNVHMRAKLYGDASCGLQIRTAPGGGMEVWLTLLRQGGARS